MKTNVTISRLMPGLYAIRRTEDGFSYGRISRRLNGDGWDIYRRDEKRPEQTCRTLKEARAYARTMPL